MPNYYKDEESGKTFLLKSGSGYTSYSNTISVELNDTQGKVHLAQDLTPYLYHYTLFRPQAIGMIFQRGDKRWAVVSQRNALFLNKNILVKASDVELSQGKFRPISTKEKEFEGRIQKLIQVLSELKTTEKNLNEYYSGTLRQLRQQRQALEAQISCLAEEQVEKLHELREHGEDIINQILWNSDN